MQCGGAWETGVAVHASFKEISLLHASFSYELRRAPH